MLIRTFVDPASRGLVLERLQAALRLIEEVHPVQFRKVQRHLDEIVVLPAGVPEYRSMFRACIIPLETVVERDTPILALLIVHEATHGRLHDIGLEKVPEECRERVESICISQEISLARRIDEGDDYWVSFARRKLETRWWEREKLEARFAEERAKLRTL